MKYIQRIDTIANIRKQWVSFCAIVIIAALGVMAYLGIHYAASAMKDAGTAYYDRTNYKDVEMIATLLMSDIDTKMICNVPGVADAEGVYATEGLMGSRAVTVQSLTKRVSVPILDAGRLPENETECVVELPKSENARERLKIGNIIRIMSRTRENAQYLRRQKFEIVGIVRHPDHVSVNMPENLYVLVDEEAFDREELDDHFMKAEITIEGLRGEDSFSRSYSEAVSSVMKDLDVLSVERARARDDEIREKGEQELAEGKRKLDEAKRKLDEFRRKLDEKEAELKAAEKKLDEAKRQLAEAKQQLKDGRRRLDEAKAQLDEAAVKIEDARAQLAEKKAQLDAGKEKLDAAADELLEAYGQIADGKRAFREGLQSIIDASLPPERAGSVQVVNDDGWGDINDPSFRAGRMQITSNTEIDLNESMDSNARRVIAESGATPEETEMAMSEAYASGSWDSMEASYDELASGAREWDEAHEEYLEKYGEYEEKLSLYREKENEFHEKESEFNSRMDEYHAGEEEYSRSKEEYENGVREYEEGQRKYKEGQKKLEQNKRLYREKQQEYRDGWAELDELKRKLENLDTCKWFGFDRNANASFVDLSMVTDNLSSLGMTFSMLFVLVGAIVCYATIGRMVDEQRTLIGTTKALGFFLQEILPKYFLFGSGSAVLGIVLGIAAAYFGLQKAILSGYRGLYVMGSIPSVMLLGLTLAVSGIGIALSMFAVFIASSSLLRLPAVTLMRVKAPSTGRLFKSRAKGGRSLYTGLIINNMLGDLRNVIVTVVSVAGCCALLVVGFTLKASVDRVMDIQFGKIVKYDKNVDFIMGRSGNAAVDLEAVFEADGVDACRVSHSYLTYQSGNAMEIAELYAVPKKGFTEFHSLFNVEDGKNLTPPDDGILIQKRMAEIHGLQPGDEFTVYDSNAKEHVARVGGVFENYTGRTMVISQAYYEELFGMEPEDNRYLVRLNDCSEEKLYNDIRDVKGFVGMKRSDGTRELFKNLSTTLNKLIAGLIVMAGLMGLFVILNLANLSITQKKNDLIVMRINGFTVPEVKRYVSTETYVTTALGILAGCLGGAGLAYRIIRTLEAPHIQLIRRVNLPAWALSALITGILMFLIYKIALRKVAGLKMTDVA